MTDEAFQQYYINQEHQSNQIHGHDLTTAMANNITTTAASRTTSSSSSSSQQGIEKPVKKPKRPIPNLIPINFAYNNNNALNLSTKNGDQVLNATNTNNLSDFNELRNKTLNNSALKDFASLFVGDEMLFNGGSGSGIGGDDEDDLDEGDDDIDDGVGDGNGDEEDYDESNKSSLIKEQQQQQQNHQSLYDKLKEKLVTGGMVDDGICECGYIGKCLSDAIIHKKNCEGSSDYQQRIQMLNKPKIVNSTRCQYCRQRCKSSADLVMHLRGCSNRKMNSTATSGGSGGGESLDESLIDNPNEPHPMENVVFVWNKLPKTETEDNDGEGDGDGDGNVDEMPESDELDEEELLDDDEDEMMIDEGDEGVEEEGGDFEEEIDGGGEIEETSNLYAIETAPGYGEVTKDLQITNENETNFSLKKVFKCPQCPFWASTASRFHVHIVGHLNQKPFECSLCSYRSNWRWDITKHIRLKTIRDPTHKHAKVLMNDETGRRNYTKYNKYITLMKVTADNNETKFLKSGEILNLSGGSSSLSNSNGNYGGIVGGGNNSGSGGGGEDQDQQQQHHHHQQHVNNDDDREMANDKKKTAFKCKKCNFRLVHVE